MILQDTMKIWLPLVCNFDKGGEHYDKQVLHKVDQQFVNP